MVNIKKWIIVFAITMCFITLSRFHILKEFIINFGIPDDGKRKLFIEFTGRFGNVVFQLTAALGMKFATNRTILFVNNGQASRLISFFPKLKDEVNLVFGIPSKVDTIPERAPSRYHKLTEIQILNSTKDVFLNGYLGEYLQVVYVYLGYISVLIHQLISKF